MKNLNNKREQEKKTVAIMIAIYCRGKHGSRRGQLCEECSELLEYANLRTDRCPFMENKTFCSLCKVHCYKPEMRERIRTVMRYSGPRMMLHNPYLAVKHLILMKREKRRLSREENCNDD